MPDAWAIKAGDLVEARTQVSVCLVIESVRGLLARPRYLLLYGILSSLDL
jgi:hypothetical protein